MLIPLFLGLMAIFMPSVDPPSCECPEPPSKENLTERQYDSLLIRQAFQGADLVFLAEVTGFEEKSGSLFRASTEDDLWDIPAEKRFGIYPRLKLKKAYKGHKDLKKRSTLSIVQRWRMCDMYFNKAETYVFFGQLDRDGNIQTNICSPNRVIRFEQQLKVVEAWME